MKHLKLYSCLFGSRLYGTQTPTSDLDLKHIVLPDLDHLLLGNVASNKVKNTNKVKNQRNGADDIDEEFIPLQVFAKHFYEGQTYAIELAWSIDGEHAEQRFARFFASTEDARWFSATADRKHTAFYKFTRELRERFLTSNIKAMMGYAVNQASLYSFKGERLNCVRDLQYILAEADAYYGNADATWENKETLGGLIEASIWKQRLAELAATYPKYFKQTEYDIGGGVFRPCFILLEKYLPFTNTMALSVRTVNALASKYGSRADSAAKTQADGSSKTVDWKATMHALRIVDEGVLLLSTGQLNFPLEPTYVAKLLAIKRGEVPIEEVTEELNSKLEALKELEMNSALQPASHDRRAELNAWVAEQLRTNFYKLPGPIGDTWEEVPYEV
jgi:hypothetical protein